MYKCEGLCRQQAGRNKAAERLKKIPLEKLIDESTANSTIRSTERDHDRCLPPAGTWR
jgi:hypothetical protein